MASRALALVGLVEALFPRGLIAVGERIAFRDRGESERRSWLTAAARAEGLLWLLLARRGSTPGRLFGVVGVPALVAPERTLDVALKLAYEDSETIEVKPWVVPVTRAIGLLYVLADVRSWRRRRASSGTPDASAGDEPVTS